MKKSLSLALCAILSLGGLPAWAQSHPSQVSAVTGQPGNQTGQDFAQAMMMNDKFEIAAGRLAAQRARDPAVRDFARDMIAAHAELSLDLKQVTDRTLVGRTPVPPPAFDPPHQQLYQALEAAPAVQFDRLFIAQQVDAHRQALAYAQGYARDGGVASLRRFAGHAVPIIRDHLAMLRNFGGSAVAKNGISATPF